MLSLKDRLLQAEDDFISSLSAGDGAVSSFADRWELLLRDVDSAMESSCLDSETATLVHTTALRIATYVDASTEIYESYNTLTFELVEQVDHLMSELTLDDKPPTSLPLGLPHPSSPSSSPSPLCTRSLGRTERASTSGRKRCRTSSPPPKALKRQCSSSISPRSLKTESIHTLSSRASALQTPNDPHVPSRKRRLSDADITMPVKPEKRLLLGPRLHAMSDSYVNVLCSDIHKADDRENAQHADLNGCLDGEGCTPSAPLDVLPVPVTTFYADHLLQAKPPGEVELSSMFLGSSFSDGIQSSGDGVDAWLTSLFDLSDITSELQTPLPPWRDSLSSSWPNRDPSRIEQTIALDMSATYANVEGVEKTIDFEGALPWSQLTSSSEDVVDFSTIFEHPQPSNFNLKPNPQSPRDSSSESSTDSEDDSPATPTMSSMLSVPSQEADFLLPMNGLSPCVKSHDMGVIDPLYTFHDRLSFAL